MGKKTTGYHHADLRQTLLETGERLLERVGGRELSLRALAREAGVSHSAPYRHFESKADLLTALAAVGFERLAQELAETTERFPDDPKRQLLASGQCYIRLGLARPALCQLMFSGIFPDSPAFSDLEEAGNNAFEMLLAIIRQGQEGGVFRNGPTLDLAMASWSMAHGITELAIAGRLPSDDDGTPPDIEALGQRLYALLLAGLLAPEATACAPSHVPPLSGNTSGRVPD